MLSGRMKEEITKSYNSLPRAILKWAMATTFK
jgi:hypothetical protein